ncbi:MAG TPA: segregation/condensation protein A [Patescibacteria group bacterium]|nr:segregation/condensation protein A [Patescibacteria group bacterium]
MEVKLAQFSGPLELLLSLLQEEKLDISTVSLGRVTQQFLEYLEKMEEKKPEEMADFLLVAARLLFSKSRLLLPQFGAEEEEGPSLEDQLRLYQRFSQASRVINKRWEGLEIGFLREEPPRRPTEFIPPGNLGLSELQESLRRLLERLKPLKPLPQTQLARTISVKEKIHQILQLLQNKGETDFSSVLSMVEDRSELIASFLAVLELVKQQSVQLKQSQAFANIVIKKI